MRLEYVPGLPSMELSGEGGSIRLEGELDPRLIAGAEETAARLDGVLAGRFYELFDGTRIAILREGVEGGGRVDAENRYIQMNYANNLLSVRQAEELLVAKGEFNPGDRLRLVGDPDAPAGVFPVELVHEMGHIVGDYLPTELSPTKYGLRALHEAFAEAFLYFVYGVPLDAEAEAEVRAAIERFAGQTHS